MSDSRKPWEKQKGESHQAFEAFQLYRDLGVSRSQAKVAQQLGKSEALMQRWSGRWSWVARCDSWDREQDRQWRLEQAEARRDIARKHLRVGAAMMSKAVQRLQSVDPAQLTPNELERWLRTAAEMERVAAGEADDSDAAGIKAAAGLVTELVRGLRDAT